MSNCPCKWNEKGQHSAAALEVDATETLTPTPPDASLANYCPCQRNCASRLPSRREVAYHNPKPNPSDSIPHGRRSWSFCILTANARDCLPVAGPTTLSTSSSANRQLSVLELQKTHPDAQKTQSLLLWRCWLLVPNLEKCVANQSTRNRKFTMLLSKRNLNMSFSARNCSGLDPQWHYVCRDGLSTMALCL